MIATRPNEVGNVHAAGGYPLFDDIEYPRVDYEGDDPLGFVIAKNLARRHLTESQRAMVAAKIAKLPQHRPEKGANLHPSTKCTAAKLGVSVRSVKTAKKVLREAPPEIVQAVEAGQMAVSAAARHLRDTPGTRNEERFTPAEHIDLAREVMGAIDLDPASDPRTQKTVKAKEFYTKDEDGLSREWYGRVWLHPPYAQPAMTQFVDKLLAEIAAGRTTAAILLTRNYSETNWFQRAAHQADMLCFPRGIRLMSPSRNSGSPAQGQTFFYFGPDADRFEALFSEPGFVTGRTAGSKNRGTKRQPTLNRATTNTAECQPSSQ